MSNYYLLSSGVLKRKDNSLTFISNDNQVKNIAVNNVDDLYIFGKVTFNCDLLSFISSKNINLHIFDYYNNYTGTFSGSNNNSGSIIVKQVNTYNNNRLYISKEILKAAKYNIIQNLKEYNIDYIDIDNLHFDEASSIQSLMGIEGNMRKRYYNQFNNILKFYKLNKRVKRPPDNEINALLSFTNMLCYSECIRAIKQTQLSASVSFLHEVQDRRNSLALDIAEIFKPVLVDRIIFKLINNRELTDKHFDKINNICNLNESGKKILLREWDDKLNTTIYHKQLKRNVKYKNLILYDVYKLLKYIIEDVEFKPFKIWW